MSSARQIPTAIFAARATSFDRLSTTIVVAAASAQTIRNNAIAAGVPPLAKLINSTEADINSPPIIARLNLDHFLIRKNIPAATKHINMTAGTLTEKVDNPNMWMLVLCKKFHGKLTSQSELADTASGDQCPLIDAAVISASVSPPGSDQKLYPASNAVIIIKKPNPHKTRCR